MDFWEIIIFFVVYFLLMKYILPKMGMPTWMSGSCDLPGEGQKKTEKEIIENIEK